MLRTKLTDPREIAGRWDNHASLALDRLDQEGDRVGGNRGFERRSVAKGNSLEAGGEGAKTCPCLIVRREADNGQSTAMKVFRTDNDFGSPIGYTLDFIAPFPNGLERALNGFRTRIHRQDHVGIGQVADFFQKGGQLVIAEGP